MNIDVDLFKLHVVIYHVPSTLLNIIKWKLTQLMTRSYVVWSVAFFVGGCQCPGRLLTFGAFVAFDTVYDQESGHQHLCKCF